MWVIHVIEISSCSSDQYEIHLGLTRDQEYNVGGFMTLHSVVSED